jgi:hypothetical protein
MQRPAVTSYHLLLLLLLSPLTETVNTFLAIRNDNAGINITHATKATTAAAATLADTAAAGLALAADGAAFAGADDTSTATSSDDLGNSATEFSAEPTDGRRC